METAGNQHAMQPGRAPLARWLAVAQGIYYLITGVWPLVHMASFVLVTGPKRDLWLVRTVGVLVVAVGLALLLGGLRRRVSLELGVLAVGCALGLTAIDVFYVSVDQIPPIYLADAVAELLLVGLWIVAAVRARGVKR